MNDLSPAAEATLNAAWNASTDTPVVEIEAIVAAALRAAADQVVPEPSELHKEIFSIAALRLRWVVRDQFLRIAAELEATALKQDNSVI